MLITKILRVYRFITNNQDSVSSSSVAIASSNPSASLKIGIIDHSYHQKTVSSSFIVDLLKHSCDLEVYWDSSWNGGKPLKSSFFNDRGFDSLIFWQVFYYYNPRDLRKVNCKKIFVVPMYDDAYTIPDRILKKYGNYYFISFSKSFHQRFTGLGLNSRYFQYFMDPVELPYTKDPFRDLHGFFWQRTNDITWTQISKLIKGSDFKSFHLHIALDALWYKEVLPTDEEMKKYNITITRWFNRREDYLKVLSKANVFFAPRLYEGIGMPFIEAMAMGKVVVATNHPTMNEYIVNGVNGILFNINDLKPVNFLDSKNIANNARKFAFNSYNNWEKTKMDLVSWILTDQK